MRLFSAVTLPPDITAHLASALTAGGLDLAALVPAVTWHLTLGFYGDLDEPAARMARLSTDLAGAEAPRLRLAGAGKFGAVRWVGVAADPMAGLRTLAVGAGADPDTFVPHVTLTRRGGGPGPLFAALDGYAGPWWRPAEVTLLASGPTGAGAVYTRVGGVALRGRDGRPDSLTKF